MLAQPSSYSSMTSPRPSSLSWLYAIVAALTGSALTLLLVTVFRPQPNSITALPTPPSSIAPTPSSLPSEAVAPDPSSTTDLLNSPAIDPLRESPANGQSDPIEPPNDQPRQASVSAPDVASPAFIPETPDVETLERFTQTLIQLQPVLQATEERLTSADTEAERDQIESEFDTAAQKLITRNGLTTATYQRIAQRMREDPVLQLAINTLAARVQIDAGDDPSAASSTPLSEAPPSEPAVIEETLPVERDPFAAPR